MNGPITQTASWTHQYYLTVTSPHGTTSGEGWYNAGATAYAGVSPLTVPGPAGVRYVFTHWSGAASGTTSPSNPITMNAPKTATANWKTQYLLTVLTNPPGLTPQPTRSPLGEAGPPNSWWYDSSDNVILTARTVTGYTFLYWDVDGVSQGTNVNPITVLMNAPHTSTAHYQAAPPPPPVGGVWVPIDTLQLLAPWIAIALIALAALAATAGIRRFFIKRR